MRFTTFLKVIFSVTLLSLVYIHMQMQIYDLAYRGKSKQNKIIQLKEEKENLSSKILKLKSASNLGIHLLKENSEMDFVNPNDIIDISMSKSQNDKNIFGKKNQESSANNPILSFLSGGRPAEARMKE